MGNTCGCTDDINKSESTGMIRSINEAGSEQYKVADCQSKINSRAFASFPEHTKNEMLAEVFELLVSTVEVERIQTTNLHIKRLLNRESGVCTNVDDDTYTGEFINGVASGKGKIKSTSRAEEYDGPMFKGNPHGVGKVTEINPNGVNGIVKFENGVATGKANFHANSTQNFKKISEGGFDKKGLKSGPYICQSHEGDLIYEIEADNVRNGPFVVIANDKSTVAVTEFKGGKEVGQLQFYTLLGTDQSMYSMGQSHDGPVTPVKSKERNRSDDKEVQLIEEYSVASRNQTK